MRLIAACFICLFSSYALGFAQRDEPESDPLQARDKAIDEIGAFVGVGPNFQTGKFFPTCDSCEFTDGRQTAFTVGALYENRAEFSSLFSWGGSVAFTRRTLESRYTEIEGIPISSAENPDVVINTKVPFRHIGTASFSYVSLQPFIKLTPIRPVFFRLGASASFLLSSTLKHEKEIMEKIAHLPNGEVAVVSYPDGSSVATLEDAEFPEASSFLLSLEPAIGSNIRLTNRITLSPVVQYSFPLSNASSHGEDFRMHALQFFAEVRIKVN